MIGVEQWRSSIGAFAGGGRRIKSSMESVSSTLNIPGSWYGVDIGGLLLCSYSLFIITILLLCSGNVELNPRTSDIQEMSHLS